jgi:hypothetical protein
MEIFSAWQYTKNENVSKLKLATVWVKQACRKFCSTNIRENNAKVKYVHNVATNFLLHVEIHRFPDHQINYCNLRRNKSFINSIHHFNVVFPQAIFFIFCLFLQLKLNLFKKFFQKSIHDFRVTYVFYVHFLSAFPLEKNLLPFRKQRKTLRNVFCFEANR